MNTANKKIRLGDLLIQQDIITENQLMSALTEQESTGQKLGKVLVKMGLVEENLLLTLLAEQLNIPYIDLNTYDLISKTVQHLPEVQARRFRVILLEERANSYLLGMSDPTDIYAVDDLRKFLGKELDIAVVREADVLNAIETIYRRTQEIQDLAGRLDDELVEGDFSLAQLEDDSDVSNAPVVRLLRTVFEEAVQANASDIHIEPDEYVVRIRQRIDGVLQEQVMNETRIAAAVVLRLKLMAGLDISEKRLPQDGRFNINVADSSIDVRLSTMPVQYGESVVMRLLNQGATMLSLEELGMPEDISNHFRDQVHNPHGMVLVTGPTGSGKTTTLYAALNELNSAHKKIITVEDPVEYRLPRINQVQVNSRIDLTFAKVLRAALRQDPDIVMVGEMRDKETVEIGIRASLTGHLVLSTLHTNDAISTAIRLIDMGIEPYLAASSLRAIIAQRLVRKICENCKQEQDLKTLNADRLFASHIAKAMKDQVFYTGKGCRNCNGTGYKGRLGIYEFLEMTEEAAMALQEADSGAFKLAAQMQPNYRSLSESALELAVKGVTSLEEAFRVTEAVNDSDVVKHD
ncbi:MAG: type II/IV secretion system protein [Gammaproteobacteria bacterium]|nr:type II/IV secretion system protein [Gammaproteobacteria bacterium]